MVVQFATFLLIIPFHSLLAAIDYEFMAILLKRHLDDIKSCLGSESECYKQIDVFESGLNQGKVWSLTLLDANGKLESGLIQGNVMMIGQYDECLGVDEQINGSHIGGHYCMAVVEPTEATHRCMMDDEDLKEINVELTRVNGIVQFQWGVCALTGCSADQLQMVWDFIENRYQFKVHLRFDDNKCVSKSKSYEYSLLTLIVLTIFSMLGIVVVASTLYDFFFFRHYKDKEFNIWMAFSFYTNTKRLISTKSTDSTSITCIYGLRTISMAWVVFGHNYFAHTQFLASNNVYLIKWIRQDSSMFILGAISGVDTFLVISGFLIVYVTAIAKERGTPVHLLVFYAHRFIRLTPALVGITLLYAGLLTHLGDGPFWFRTHSVFKQNCIKNWWTGILYIQNYYDATRQCIQQAWYLSVDTQLYILSPILLIFLFKWPKSVLIVIIALICACIVGNIQTARHYDLTSWTLSEVHNYYVNVYLPTHLRAAPWLIGLVLGYLMIKVNGKRVYIGKIYVITMWLTTLITMLLICYSYVIITKYRIPALTVAIFNVLVHLSWAICVCWVIFACTKGYGGFVGQFLSSPLFCVLSRITYGIFITHPFVIWYLLLRRRTHTYVDNTYQFHEFWGSYMLSIGLGFIWTLVFESPASILQSVAKKKANVWIEKFSPGLLLK